MEEQKLKISQNENYLTQGIKFRITQNDKNAYRINRQRAISEFTNKEKPLSPHSQSIKEKHIIYKKDLLMQRFQNLQLNQINKNQKKPIKLRLQKANKQNNQFLVQRLNKLQNDLQFKLEAQNSIIKRSLNKLQRLIQKSAQKSQQNNNVMDQQKRWSIQGNKSNLLRIRAQVSNNQSLKVNKLNLNKSNQISQNSNQRNRIKSNWLKQTQNQPNKLAQHNNNIGHSYQTQNKINPIQNQQYANLKEQLDRMVQKYKESQKQIQRLNSLIQQIQEQKSKTKQNNSYLTAENYKMSLQNAMLKQQLIDIQTNQYQNFFQQMEQEDQNQAQNNLQQNISQTNQQEIQSQQNQELKDRQNQKSNKLLKKDQKSQKIKTYKKLNQKFNPPKKTQVKLKTNKFLSGINKKQSICQSDLQNFSLKARNSQQEELIQRQKKFILDLNNLNMNQQHRNFLLYHVNNLKFKISNLQRQLNDQKTTNELLSNQVASLRLKLFSFDKNSHKSFSTEKQANKDKKKSQRQKSKDDLSSAISIQLDQIQKQKFTNLNTNQTNSKQKQQQILQSINSEQKVHNKPDQKQIDCDVIKQSKKQINNSLKAFSCKGTKSNILSNQIIYFAQNIHSIKQNINQQTNQKNAHFSKKHIKQNKSRSQLNQNEQIQRKRTQCMKKIQTVVKNIQIPVQYMEKRRKSMSQMMNSSFLKKNQKIKNTISFYSNQKISQLQVLRDTLSLKFQAFKYTYQLFQNQMSLWPTPKAKITDLISILQQYPFFLDQNSISVLLSHCNIGQQKQVRVDIFCNKLKQFIKQYEQMSEQEQLILQKKIYKRWKYIKQELMQLLKKNQNSPGQISKQKFKTVFQQFKFQQKQIHHLLCQNVAISSDVNHIKYIQYFQNFFTKQ